MATFLNLCSGGAAFASNLGVFPWRFYLQKDDKLLSADKRGLLESTTQELTRKLGIRKPVELMEKKGLICGTAQAQGVELFSARAGLAIDPDWIGNLSEAEHEFILAHELSHIKQNDVMWLGIASGVVGVITTLAMCILFPWSATYYFSEVALAILTITSPAALTGQFVSIIACAFFSQWMEKRADKLAMTVCSESARKSAPALIKRAMQDQIEHRNKEGNCLSMLWRRCLINEDGDVRIDIFHPSCSSRIDYLTPLTHSGI